MLAEDPGLQYPQIADLLNRNKRGQRRDVQKGVKTFKKLDRPIGPKLKIINIFNFKLLLRDDNK